jgi:hypothetical protein
VTGRPPADLEFVGGPRDGHVSPHQTVVAVPEPGYSEPVPAGPTPRRPARRWVARWVYPRSGVQPEPYCNGVQQHDDRGWKRPCGRGCPAFRRTR